MMKVFIDMDGVLADFVGGAKELFGVDKIDWSVSSDILQHFPVTPENFWKACDYDFWRNLKKTYFVDELISFLRETFYLEELCVVSKPCLTIGCVPGKQAWLQKHYPELKKQMFGNAREFLAGPNTILIDDFEKNCRKFENHGGQSCLVKRPWNTDEVFDTMESVKNDIKKAIMQTLIG